MKKNNQAQSSLGQWLNGKQEKPEHEQKKDKKKNKKRNSKNTKSK